MGYLNLSAKQIYRNVTRKLHLENVRSNREQYGDYYLDGKYQFTVKMPNIHGGSGSVTPGMLKMCRESVRLSTKEYANLVRCPMASENYDQLIRERIENRSPNR